MELKIKKLHPDAKIPKYALPGDAGMDLFSVEQHSIKPGEKANINTGIAIEIPQGYAGLIWDKSGLALKSGLKTVGGVFDSGYRGEYTIGLVNLGIEPYEVEVGSKIAQLLIQKIEQPTIIECDDLSTSDRGDSRFGSTGKK